MVPQNRARSHFWIDLSALWLAESEAVRFTRLGMNRRWDFRPRTGTADVVIPHTSMDDQSNSKYSGMKAGSSQIRFSTQTRLASSPLSKISPARQLMICLGWLRLFQVIVSEYQKPALRRPSPYEV